MAVDSKACAMRWRMIAQRMSNSGSTHWWKACAGAVQRSVGVVVIALESPSVSATAAAAAWPGLLVLLIWPQAHYSCTSATARR